MSVNGSKHDARVLRWTGKLFSAADLRRHWHGQTELVVERTTIITPLADDELRAKGIQLVRQDVDRVSRGSPHHGGWGFAQETPDSLVTAAAQALQREGIHFASLPADGSGRAGRFRELGEQVERGASHGIVLFCREPMVVAAVANRAGGLRAAAVLDAAQTKAALASLGANFLAVGMPGRTYFEIRQILRLAAGAAKPHCPAEVARLLEELDGHAHR